MDVDEQKENMKKRFERKDENRKKKAKSNVKASPYEHRFPIRAEVHLVKQDKEPSSLNLDYFGFKSHKQMLGD